MCSTKCYNVDREVPPWYLMPGRCQSSPPTSRYLVSQLVLRIQGYVYHVQMWYPDIVNVLITVWIEIIQIVTHRCAFPHQALLGHNSLSLSLLFASICRKTVQHYAKQLSWQELEHVLTWHISLHANACNIMQWLYKSHPFCPQNLMTWTSRP